MTKQEASAAYAAYAELEAAAEAFYAAATKMMEFCPREAPQLGLLCTDINILVTCCDVELDEVL